MQTTPQTGALAQAQAVKPSRSRSLVLPRLSRSGLYLIGLGLLGLALRLWFIALTDLDPRFSASDDGDYFQRALRLAVSGVYLDNSWLIRPPGHIFVFAGLIKLGLLLGDPGLSVVLIRGFQVALSLLLIPLGYDLARRLFNPATGLIFATVLALWLPMVELPSLVLSEPLFFFSLVGHLWLLVRWRDAWQAGQPGAWRWLIGAGLVLGYGALTRSPALYGAVFSLILVLWETRSAGLWRPWALRFGIAALAMLIPMAAMVAPWTLRNYLLYGQLILVDNTGPVNLWLALQEQRIDGGKTVLAGMDQVERHAFVRSETRRILSEDPLRIMRNFWPHFSHIWKAQFIEDFFVKVSFYARPLREIWLLGVLSDLAWFGLSAAAAFGLSSRPREGGFRLLALGWVSYTCLTVMLIHVEPRYLLPLWLFLALYGSAAFAALRHWFGLRRCDRPQAQHVARDYLRSPWGLMGLALVTIFVTLVLSYRTYPQIIADGLAREQYRNAALRAQAAGDRAAAIAAYEQMLTVAPNFVDGRSELALLYLDQGELDRAWQAVGERHTHRSDVVRGAIARAQGNDELAVALFTDAEVRAGEDVQRLALRWLNPVPLSHLRLGNGLDFGYLDGFSFGEQLAAGATSATRSYRWLGAKGSIVLPLPAPLTEGTTVRFRVAGGLPGETPLTVRIGDLTTTLPIRGGEWRRFALALPADLVGQTSLTIEFAAPTFIPFQQNPASDDARLLSVMISDVIVE
ncbi:MAG: glycosyltransferase family 39 protein [Oscillochloridaceae bacterium umkhey_bin13]